MSAYRHLYNSTSRLRYSSPEDIQRQFRRLFTALSHGLIDREDYSKLCDLLHTVMPRYNRETQNLNKRINRRCDDTGRRTCGEFALEIYDGNRREVEVVQGWMNYMVSSGRLESAVITNNGMDNSGCVQYLTRDVNCRADFLIRTQGEFSGVLEVKMNLRGLQKATFKVHNLESYLRQDASMLVIWFEGADRYWAVLTPVVIRKMLDTLPHEERRELGGMPCVQLLEYDYDRYFKVERMEPGYIKHETHGAGKVAA